MTITWITPLDLRAVPGRDEFELLGDLIVRVGRVEYCAPAQMRSDGQSAGRILWVWEGHPWNSRDRRPAVIHDAGYRGALRWRVLGQDEWSAVPLSRARLDVLFRALVASEQAATLPKRGWRRKWATARNVVVRWKKWLGLRLFGARNYKAGNV